MFCKAWRNFSDLLMRFIECLLESYMKTILLAFAVLAMSYTAGNADSSVPNRLGLLPIPANGAMPAKTGVMAMPKLSLAPLPGTTHSTVPSSPSEFAQLGSQQHALPISPSMVFGLIALFVLALRIMGVNHARAMADHERDSHHGKAEMFRALQAERASR